MRMKLIIYTMCLILAACGPSGHAENVIASTTSEPFTATDTGALTTTETPSLSTTSPSTLTTAAGPASPAFIKPEYQFDLIHISDGKDVQYSYDGQNVIMWEFYQYPDYYKITKYNQLMKKTDRPRIAQTQYWNYPDNLYENEKVFNQAIVYNRKMEKTGEFYINPQTAEIDETENTPKRDLGKYGYNSMSEFQNGFSFVREKAVGDLPLGYSGTHRIFAAPCLYDEPFDASIEENAKRIAEESEKGFKFIDGNGNVIIDNLEATVEVTYIIPVWDSAGGHYVDFQPAFFTEYGMAAVKKDGRYGIINKNGKTLCDFIYNGITIVNENIAIVTSGVNTKRLYYIKSGKESEFKASDIVYLNGSFFNYSISNEGDFFTEYNPGDEFASTEKGVIDMYGNIVLPGRWLRTVDGSSAIAYMFEGNNVPPFDTYYNKYLDVVCGNNLHWLGKDEFEYFPIIDSQVYVATPDNSGTYDSNGDVVWDDLSLRYPVGGSVFFVSSRDNFICGLAAINEIPEPSHDVGNKYIALMINNPLINIDGTTKLLETDNYFFGPLIEDGIVLIPFQAICEALGADVRWDEATKTLTAKKDRTTVACTADKKEIYVNGNKVQMEIPAKFINHNVFTPLMAVTEAFGASVELDEERQLITIIP